MSRLSRSERQAHKYRGSNCSPNWISKAIKISTQGAAMVRHSDISGPATNPTAKFWNAAHPSRGPEGGFAPSSIHARTIVTWACVKTRRIGPVSDATSSISGLRSGAPGTT